MKTKSLICLCILSTLVSILLIVLVGGCKEMGDIGPSVGGMTLDMFFVNSEGKDLVEGIPVADAEGKENYFGDYIGKLLSGKYRISHISQLSPGEYLLKLFLDDKEVEYRVEVSVWNMEGIIGKPPYYAVSFRLVHYTKFNQEKVRCEVICPYIFGDYEAHTLEGELDGTTFRRCWFDGVEASSVYPLPDFSYENAFIVQVDR
jgi:hypothetical protein